MNVLRLILCLFLQSISNTCQYIRIEIVQGDREPKLWESNDLMLRILLQSPGGGFPVHRHMSHFLVEKQVHFQSRAALIQLTLLAAIIHGCTVIRKHLSDQTWVLDRCAISAFGLWANHITGCTRNHQIRQQSRMIGNLYIAITIHTAATAPTKNRAEQFTKSISQIAMWAGSPRQGIQHTIPPFVAMGLLGLDQGQESFFLIRDTMMWIIPVHHTLQKPLCSLLILKGYLLADGL